MIICSIGNCISKLRKGMKFSCPKNIKYLVLINIYRQQRSCSKVMFLYVSVILFTGGACVVGGMCVPGGMYVAGDMCSVGACVAGGMVGRHAWQGACVVGVCMVGGVHGREGMHGRGMCMAGGMHGTGMCVTGGMCGRGHTWQERWPLQRAVRILLECILVVNEYWVLNKKIYEDQSKWWVSS